MKRPIALPVVAALAAGLLATGRPLISRSGSVGDLGVSGRGLTQLLNPPHAADRLREAATIIAPATAVTALLEDDAARLAHWPEVVLYTREPLAELPCGVAHAPSGPADGSEDGEPRHRYTGLRLLAEAGNRLFLVPAHWDEADSRTLVVPYDATIRLELRPPPATPPAPC
jgi:hypothetical protein